MEPALGLERPMTIRNELIDELLAGQDPSSVMRQDGLLGGAEEGPAEPADGGRVRAPSYRRPGRGREQEPPQRVDPQACPDR